MIGAGGLRGAYDTGVVAELCRNLGPDYFDAIYACSAGAYAAAHFVLNQPDSEEYIWRNLLDGNKFINLFNPLQRRNILDLEYLIDILKHPDTLLHIENLPQIRTRLIYTLTDQKTGQSVYF